MSARDQYTAHLLRLLEFVHHIVDFVMKNPFATIVALLCIAIAVIGCSSHNEEQEEPTRFVVSNPLRTDTSVVQEYVCQIHAIQHIELRAMERGYLEKILVDEGQVVRKGQLLFQILPTLYDAEFRKAQAEARVAQIEYQNTKTLADKKIVSQNELAMVKARLEKAEAEKGLAQAHLNFTRITAPFTGIVDRLHVRTGSLLEEGDMLSSLSDNSQMWVYFNVPEAQYLNYRTRLPQDSSLRVALRMANNEMFPHQGVVTTIEADFNNETGNIAFRATFPNPKGLLRHGETGNILITEPLKNVLLIPQKATFEVLDKKYVYVVGKDNIVRSRAITIQAELPHLFAIQGLSESDRIVIEGIRKIKQNEKIQFTTVDSRKALRSLELDAE